ncbi:glycosyltransferase [Furfurilactobacillus curtus]|uniref:Glycosyl transferase n=1 Tax=Furfurilactobacillus curtus TaxID=1746200 RepID=A0ABQ5JNB9_9LACO
MIGLINRKYSALIAVHQNERPEHFQSALASIFDQTVLPAQMIIVKDGRRISELDDVIDQYKCICQYRHIDWVYLENPQVMGLTASLNQGLTMCRESLVARFDSDDVNVPERMEKTLQKFAEDPELSVVGSWIGEFATAIEDVTGIRKVPMDQAAIQRLARRRNPMNHMAVTFRREAVMSLGGYTEMPSFEDYYLWLGMLSQQMKFANLQETLVWARAGSHFWERRSGWYYLRRELHFQSAAYRQHYLSLSDYLGNIVTRCAVRLMPKLILALAYKTVRSQR